MVRVEINNQQISKYGFINKTGKEIISIKYDDAFDFYKETVPVKLNNKWFLINKNDEKISKEYDIISDFDNGYAIIYINKKYGIINDKGEEVVKPILNYIAFDYDEEEW